MAPQGNLLSFNTKQNKILHKTKMERSPVASGSILEHSNDRNDCKRPDISEPKQILDVTSRLLSAIIYVFAYEKINQNKVMS